MSLVFSSPTTRAGIVELIDDLCDSNEGTYPITEKTRDINLAQDEVLSLIFQVGGTWQFDDVNHGDYPVITTDINVGQRDYSFVTDESGNLILDIYRVQVADQDGLFVDLTPYDVSSSYAPASYTDGLNVRGKPNSYDKLANGIFLDPIPDYSRANGLKVYINREGSYFTTADTTKKPGFAGLFHEYLAIRPAYFYAIRNNLKNVNFLGAEMQRMKTAIMDYYKVREKDAPPVLLPKRNRAH